MIIGHNEPWGQSFHRGRYWGSFPQSPAFFAANYTPLNFLQEIRQVVRQKYRSGATGA